MPQPRPGSLVLYKLLLARFATERAWVVSLVNSCTRSRSSSSSSSVGGAKPAGCLVETLRAKTGENAGVGTRRSERVVVRRREGRRSEAIVMNRRGRLGVCRGKFLNQVNYLNRAELQRGRRQSSARRDRLIYTRSILAPAISIHNRPYVKLLEFSFR